MSSVLLNLHRRTIRGPINVLDKSTIFSIFPREITEVKHTIQPGVFTIPAGTEANPSRLVVGTSSWWRDIDPDQPLLEIPVSSVLVAESIIKDWANGIYLSNMNDAMPGLFYTQGDISVLDLKKDKKPLLDKAIAAQKKWYEKLVDAGDSLWARSNGNPLAVMDDMRMAAQQLGRPKDWLSNYQAAELVKCVACGTLRNPQFPICANCKTVIDKVKAKELGLIQVA